MKNFYEFITEGLEYKLFRGVYDTKNVLNFLKKGYIYDSGEFKNNVIRKSIKDIDLGNGISATRNFNYALQFDPVIEFNTSTLTDEFKVVPFAENPDFYLKHMNKYKKHGALKLRKKKKYGSDYWDYKTNKYVDDFGIAEEIIVTDKIPIKHIDKIFFTKSRYNDEVLRELEKHNIKYQILESDITQYSQTRYPELKRLKTFNQI